MAVVKVVPGTTPLILGFPHVGTEVPPEIWGRLNDNGKILADTDWHVDRLYDGLLPDVTTVRATFHRYVIDANRDPSGASLYPGRNTTGLIPETDFDGRAIWSDARSTTTTDIAERLARFHAPYHAALAAEIARVKSIHGFAILYDCHSIRSRIPFLFDGKLPDFNIGTDNRTTCAKSIETAAFATAKSAAGFTAILNGRFKGGWTTRHYGRPAEGVHAIQMELCQSTHLVSEAPPFAYDAAKAGVLRGHLRVILERIGNVGGD
jgi:N-formylglutamate deformylase